MKLREILSDVEILTGNCDMDLEITGIGYDSRKIKPGDLFIAKAGVSKKQNHGADYAASAAARGALCMVSDRETGAEIPTVLVPDSSETLARIAANFYGHPARDLTVIGVTGTKGKTTVSHLIKSLLEGITGEKCGLIGSIRVLSGDRVITESSTTVDLSTTPESLDLHRMVAEMKNDGCRTVVMEVSSHALDTSRVNGIDFEAGVFTNLAHDHLDYHETMENYAAAKARLFSRCKKSIINLDDSEAGRMIASAAGSVLTYAVKDNTADLVAKNIRLMPDAVEFEALTDDSIRRMRLEIPGMFSCYNALAAVGCALAMGFDGETIAAALRGAKSVKGRVEAVKTGRPYHVLIDYAHTPESLEQILRTVRMFAPARVVVLFGCGGDRDRTKRPIMGAVATGLADFTVITSDNPRTEQPDAIIDDIVRGVSPGKAYIRITDRREAIVWVLDNAQPQDVIILAGKGHETYQDVGGKKYDLDERQVIAQHLGLENQR